MLRRLAGAIAAVVVLLVAGGARAQIFNVQPLLDKLSPRGFSGALEGSADWRTGNTNLLMLGGSAHGQWHRDPHLVFATLHGELGLTNGSDEVVSKDLEHVRYRFRLSSALAVEAFAQHDADAFRRLAIRAIGGAGVRARLVNGPHVTFAVAAAPMVEYEKLARGMYPDSGEEVLDYRLSTYAVVAVTSRYVLLAHTVYMQPRFDDFHDVRMLGDSSMSLIVSKHLSVRFSVTVTLDTQPPAGVRPIDSDVRSTLAATF